MAHKTADSAVLLLSHVHDNGVKRLFRSLSKAASPRFQPFFLGDNTRNIFARFQQDAEYSLFTRRDLKSLNYPGKNPKGYEADHPHRNMQLGHTELPILWFFQRNPAFSYYWIIEYDVRFTGSWSRLFDYFEPSAADLLCTTLMTFGERPHWTWWQSLDLRDLSIAEHQYMCAFFPVYRISHRALQCLNDHYEGGVSGHYECLVPTLLRHSNFEMEDIGGDGPFVRPENINRFYVNDRRNAGLSPGTFVYRPTKRWPGLKRDTLWHPVKHPSVLTALKRRANSALDYMLKPKP